MHKVIIFWSVLGLFLSCGGQKKPLEAKVTQEAGATNSSVPAARKEGSFATPVNPGQGFYIQQLTKNYWIIDKSANMADRHMAIYRLGRWYKLEPDGTYTYGLWDTQIGNGSWFVRDLDKKTPVITLDSKYDDEDEEWVTQINKELDQMAWTSTSRFPNGNKGVMSHLMNLMTKPAKSQFGITE